MGSIDDKDNQEASNGPRPGFARIIGYPRNEGSSGTIDPLILDINPGSAPAEKIAELLASISLLYELEGGEGISFLVDEMAGDNNLKDSVSDLIASLVEGEESET